MKLRLDTTNKIIALEEDVKLGDLLDILEGLLPNGKWADFTLNVITAMRWSDPIIIDRYPQPTFPQPSYPSYPSYPNYPWITYGDKTGNLPQDDIPSYTINNGVFNVSVDV